MTFRPARYKCYLVALLIELTDHGLLGGVLRAELPDAMKLIGQDTAHTEGGPGHEAALDAFVEPVKLVGFGSGHG